MYAYEKNWIFALIALTALSCSKRSTEKAPREPERVTFSATVNNLIEIAPKATSPVPQSTKLGVYAFQGENLPADNVNNDADNALWSGASNIPYAWNANSFVQSSGDALYWMQTVPLSFASYFPYQSAGITGYTLNVDIADQSSAPDYGFAWAKLEGASEPTGAAALTFDYKVAKVTLTIVGDGTTIGTNGLNSSDFESIRIYTTASTGLYKTFSLDLLSGATSGEENLTANAPLKLQGSEQAGGAGQPSAQSWVKAVAYLAPSVDAELKSEGITVEIVYNDEGIKRTFISSIKEGSGSLSGDASLKNGIQAGSNYKYTLTLSKSQIMFSGVVADWNDTEEGEPATGLAADKSNSAIVKPNGGSVTFDIRKCLNNGFTTEDDLNNMMGASSTLTADVLWQDGDVIHSSDVILDAVHGLLSVKSTRSKVGNAVVALYPNASKNQGEILWSWHVWVTDYDPDAIVAANAIAEQNTAYTASGASGQVHTYGPSYWSFCKGKAIMDRNLGATRTYYSAPEAANSDADENAVAECFGMSYQWGRKDPFPPALGSSINGTPPYIGTPSIVPIYAADGVTPLDANVSGVKKTEVATAMDGGKNALPYAVKNPLTFIKGDGGCGNGDWYTNDGSQHNDDLWGLDLSKSAYDPCPKGWRTLPDARAWRDFSANGVSDFLFWNQGAQSALASYVSTNGRLYTPAGKTAPLTWYPSSGYYAYSSGALLYTGSSGYYWSSMGGYNTANQLQFNANDVSAAIGTYRGTGAAVRCVQE